MTAPRALARIAGRTLDGLRTRVALRGATRVGAGVRVFGWPTVMSEGELTVGRDVVFVSSPAPIELLVARGGTLTIGDGSLIESGATLRVRGKVIIGSRVRVGVGCIVDDDGGAPEGITVLDGAWIEDGAVLLGGARVAAGATVSRGVAVSGASGGEATRVAEVARDEHAARAIEDRIRTVVARVVPSASSVEMDTDLRVIKGWDSLAALRVLVALEKEFAVILPHDLFTQRPRLGSVTPHVLAVDSRVAGTQ